MAYDLRQLFVEHTFTTQDAIPVEPGTVRLVATTQETSNHVLFDKPAGATALIVDSDGSSITSLSRPSRVVVPFVQYPGGPEVAAEAVQERLLSIICALALTRDDDGIREVKLEWVTSFMQERLGRMRPLKALLTNEKTAPLLRSYVGAIPVHAFKTLPPETVFGLTEPQFVGHVTIDLRRTTPTEAHVGILGHGGVVGARIK